MESASNGSDLSQHAQLQVCQREVEALQAALMIACEQEKAAQERAGLGLLSILGMVNAWTLLAFTFALGLGSAMNAPVWQAIIPELVPKSDLAAAVALNGCVETIAIANR